MIAAVPGGRWHVDTGIATRRRRAEPAHKYRVLPTSRGAVPPPAELMALPPRARGFRGLIEVLGASD